MAAAVEREKGEEWKRGKNAKDKTACGDPISSCILIAVRLCVYVEPAASVKPRQREIWVKLKAK